MNELAGYTHIVDDTIFDGGATFDEDGYHFDWGYAVADRGHSLWVAAEDLCPCIIAQFIDAHRGAEAFGTWRAPNGMIELAVVTVAHTEPEALSRAMEAGEDAYYDLFDDRVVWVEDALANAAD